MLLSCNLNFLNWTLCRDVNCWRCDKTLQKLETMEREMKQGRGMDAERMFTFTKAIGTKVKRISITLKLHGRSTNSWHDRCKDDRKCINIWSGIYQIISVLICIYIYIELCGVDAKDINKSSPEYWSDNVW